MTTEEWRDVVDYEGIYIVSNQGRVARLLKGREGTNGYMAVILSLRWKFKARNIHNLVMDAFVGVKPFPKAEVDHIDSDKSNNKSNNLRYVTRSQNILARWNRNGKMTKEVKPNGEYSISITR